MKEVPGACSKCGGNLVQGYSVDSVGIAATPLVCFWIEGEPTKRWYGAQVPRRADERIPIAHFRCASCGFLESYSRPEFAMT
jgi:hypothetical protein